MQKFIAILILSAATACGTETTATPDGTLPAKDQKNISYGNNAQQKYDIYLPAGRNAATTKVFVFIHGGGWTSGSKDEMDGIIPALKDYFSPKYAIVNMNYVLANASGNYILPNQINDIQAVLDDIKAKSSQYAVKPEFVLCGNSAGGHLAMYYTFTKNNPEVKAAVNIVGPADLEDPYFLNGPFAPLYSVLINPAAIPQGMTAAQFASPVRWITNASAPTISFYGTTDTTVPLSQKDRLEAKMTSAGATHETYTYPAGHNDWLYNPHAAFIADKTRTFLNKYNP